MSLCRMTLEALNSCPRIISSNHLAIRVKFKTYDEALAFVFFFLVLDHHVAQSRPNIHRRAARAPSLVQRASSILSLRRNFHLHRYPRKFQWHLSTLLLSTHSQWNIRKGVRNDSNIIPTLPLRNSRNLQEMDISKIRVTSTLGDWQCRAGSRYSLYVC